MIEIEIDIVNVWSGTHAHVGGVAASHEGDGGDGHGARGDPYHSNPGTKLCLDTSSSITWPELLAYTCSGTKLCLDISSCSAGPELPTYSGSSSTQTKIVSSPGAGPKPGDSNLVMGGDLAAEGLVCGGEGHRDGGGGATP